MPCKIRGELVRWLAPILEKRTAWNRFRDYYRWQDAARHIEQACGLHVHQTPHCAPPWVE